MNAPVDVSKIRIETSRLIIRPWTAEDLNDLFEYACVEGVGEMAGWKHHCSIEESKTILSAFIHENKTLALELKNEQKVIGSVGLEPGHEDSCLPDDLDGREIGYVLSKEYWGRGIMTEAVRAVIRHCFAVLGFDYLTCGHFIHNDRSRRVVEKCGFQFLKNSVTHTARGVTESGMLYVLYNPNKVR